MALPSVFLSRGIRMDAQDAERVTDVAWAAVNKCEIGPWALKLFSAHEDKISNFQSRSKGSLVSYCLFENWSIQISQPHFLCAWHPDLFFFWFVFLKCHLWVPGKWKPVFWKKAKWATPPVQHLLKFTSNLNICTFTENSILMLGWVVLVHSLCPWCCCFQA